MEAHSRYKRPESVLVVVYTATGNVLLLRRADREPPFWQSVTGSMKWDEHDPAVTAARELREETGLSDDGRLHDWKRSFRFEIMPPWTQRFAPGTRENVEHLFSLELPAQADIRLNPAEHGALAWLPFAEALEHVSSWTNREAIRLVQRAAHA